MTALLNDPDETVRWNAARRLPRRYLLNLRNDPHREVRIRVASLLEPEDLPSLMEDTDYYVRLVVARRIPASETLRDDYGQGARGAPRRRQPHLARCAVAHAGGRGCAVRLAVARRLTPVELIGLQRDPDWRVRYEAASRMVPGMLAAMLDDPGRDRP